jgi:SAM-dependent methyltransferase
VSGGYRDLFKGTAWYYARYRPAYPAPFLEHLAASFSLEGTGRLLDLGTGTGQLAIPLTRYFAKVIAMDPEPEMLVEAVALASLAGAGNIRWLEGGSADLEHLQPALGKFRLVTMGASFHWMEQAATLATLAGMITEDAGSDRSGIVIAGSPSLWNQEGEWQQALKGVLQRWLGETRRAGSSTYVEPKEPFARILARSPFPQVETYRLEYQRTWELASLLGYLYSTSFSSPAVLGDRRMGFEEEVKQTLRALNPSGQFTETVALEAFLARRS